ncbi:MAG: hypothetical protein IPL43_06480 [Micropruina sp.]|nr:hypothetical protein [Micropruina sp.]
MGRQHYRFAPERHEHRFVTVAAYDNEADFEAAVETLRKSSGRVDSRDRDRAEHVCGVVWPPGHQAEQAFGRTVRKAMHHGVDPRRVPLEAPLLERELLRLG